MGHDQHIENFCKSKTGSFQERNSVKYPENNKLFVRSVLSVVKMAWKKYVV